jgi:hypothetical protein
MRFIDFSRLLIPSIGYALKGTFYVGERGRSLTETRHIKPMRARVTMHHETMPPTEPDTFLTARCDTRDEVFSRPCPVRKSPGVYGWRFRTSPDR